MNLTYVLTYVKVIFQILYISDLLGTQLLIAGTAVAASIVMFRLRGLTGWLSLQVGDSWDRFITAEYKIKQIQDAINCVKYDKALKVALRF